MDFGYLSCFHERRSPFPPSTTTWCLSSAPYHGPGFQTMGFWDQIWALCWSHDPWGAHPSCGGQKLRMSPLWWLGCWSTGLLGPKRWWCVWQLCLLPGEQPWTGGSPFDAESPGRQNGGDCSLAESFVVCTWEEVSVNICFVFFFLFVFPSFPPPFP